MGNNKIIILIAAAQRIRMVFRDRLLVQNMRVGSAVYAFDTGQPCIVTVFIHIRRIERIGRFSELLREFPGKHDAELGRVVTASYGSLCIIVKLLVDRDHAALL